MSTTRPSVDSVLAVPGAHRVKHAQHGDASYRQPPPSKSQHARIVRDLGLRIVSGQLKPGERLPAEAQLCADYDVSRPVLREATRVLVAKGLVVSRQRSGASVRPRSDWHLLDPDVLYWLTQSMPAPQFVDLLLTARRVFEPAAAALAASVASAEQLASVQQAYHAMEAATTADELLEPDLAFHRRIAEATGNDLLAYIGHMLSLALRESIQLSNRLPNVQAVSLPRHKAILTALLNRDALAARQATLVQLEGTRDDLQAVFGRGAA